MGLIKALKDAVSGTISDQWREYFYCDALDNNVLVTKGTIRTDSKRSNSNKGKDNIISNGAIIAVNEGQCMVIVDQGKIVEVCAEAGEFIYDSSSEPSIFFGSLGENIKNTFSVLGKRISFSGDTAKDQRIYFFNTKEIIGNKYGTPNPIPFRVTDANIRMDIDISLRCSGEYSFKLKDPILFYTNVCGNVTDDYTKDAIDTQLKTELVTALQPAFAQISAMGIRYSAIPAHTMELADMLNNILSKKWLELRGIEIVSFGISTLKASEEDEEMIKNMQRESVYRDPTMAAANLTLAQGEAMKAAGANTSAGPMMAFAGMNMAGNAGGMNASNLFAMGQAQQTQQPQQMQQPQQQQPQQAAPVVGWTCSCGAVNKGKFCSECGSPKPAGALLYKCDKCGWEPENPAKPPKFCPECGDVFDDRDVK